MLAHLHRLSVIAGALAGVVALTTTLASPAAAGPAPATPPTPASQIAAHAKPASRATTGPTPTSQVAASAMPALERAAPQGTPEPPVDGHTPRDADPDEYRHSA
ncbi:hypothetical protein [Nonomuraea endophytica]|uniref:hypothetical protein n=1 Tax=Nonomuraea endophytica TaxID=714136 RepID=UPI0037CBF5E0